MRRLCPAPCRSPNGSDGAAVSACPFRQRLGAAPELASAPRRLPPRPAVLVVASGWFMDPLCPYGHGGEGIPRWLVVLWSVVYRGSSKSAKIKARIPVETPWYRWL